MIPKGSDIPEAYKVPLEHNIRGVERVLHDIIKELKAENMDIRSENKDLQAEVWKLTVDVAALEDTLS